MALTNEEQQRIDEIRIVERGGKFIITYSQDGLSGWLEDTGAEAFNTRAQAEVGAMLLYRGEEAAASLQATIDRHQSIGTDSITGTITDKPDTEQPDTDSRRASFDQAQQQTTQE